MDEKILGGVPRTDENSLVIQIPKELTPYKMIIIDLLLLIVLICVFFVGFMIGERTKYIEIKTYYENYINDTCICIEKNIPTGVSLVPQPEGLRLLE